MDESVPKSVEPNKVHTELLTGCIGFLLLDILAAQLLSRARPSGSLFYYLRIRSFRVFHVGTTISWLEYPNILDRNMSLKACNIIGCRGEKRHGE